MPRPTCGAEADVSAPPVLVMALIFRCRSLLFAGVTAVKLIRG